MFDFMKKMPGGLFLIPIFITAIIYSFWPTLFQIGGGTQALFSAQGINYAIGVLLFCSGTGLNLSPLPSVMKKEGILVFVKLILSLLFYSSNASSCISMVSLQEPPFPCHRPKLLIQIYLPVIEFLLARMSSGVPSAITLPPLMPPSGPRSTIQSEALMTC